MSASATPSAGTINPAQPGDHVLWIVPFAVLLVWQIWMTLGLFGAQEQPSRLVDERPLLSGRHPLHLYHGSLGSATLLRGRGMSCYDPNFYAGYPKTPVFDPGSRPAELALALGGGRLRPGVYKLAVALICAVVPALLWLGARGLGMPRAAAMLACLLGVLVWWGRACREDIEAGDMDLLLAAVLVVAQSGLLIRFHRDPGATSFVAVVVTGLLGWFAHPLFMALMLPSFFAYYLRVGRRHSLAWHVALFGGLSGAVLANMFWLIDWVRYWWIRVPPQLELPLLAHRTFRTIWEAPLWGTSGDRTLGCVLMIAGLVGLGLWNWGGQRATARLFGLTAAALMVLAVLGIAAEPVGRLGAARLIVPGLLFAVLPAAHALGTVIGRMRRAAVGTSIAAVCVVVPHFLVTGGPTAGAAWLEITRGPAPLEIGYSSDRRAILDFLGRETTTAARILWEERHGDRLASRWSALLASETGRSFMGGLDPDAGIEHAAAGLIDQCLAGKPLSEWADTELREYCERYNIGWVVCWTPGSAERFRKWGDAEMMCELTDGSRGWAFAIRRGTKRDGALTDYVLTGSARWVRADARQIVLEDVRPEDGEVVLSLHYQAGLRVTPGRVHIERAPDWRDPVPFIRLLVKDPVARVTIVWDRQ